MHPDEDENDPYTRWQGFRIAQLGFCIALFLTFSVGTLGFSANLLVQPWFSTSNRFARISFFCSFLFGAGSVLFGSAACLTRLEDFRKTAQVARHRSKSEMAAQVERWRKEYKRLERWTWRLFNCQLIAFGVQATLLIVTLCIAYWPRLS